MIAEGKVRYAFLNTYCTHKAASLNPACSARCAWIREHGTDVSRKAGLPAASSCTCCPERSHER